MASRWATTKDKEVRVVTSVLRTWIFYGHVAGVRRV
jgi:hypothetical protein